MSLKRINTAFTTGPQMLSCSFSYSTLSMRGSWKLRLWFDARLKRTFKKTSARSNGAPSLKRRSSISLMRDFSILSRPYWLASQTIIFWIQTNTRMLVENCLEMRPISYSRSTRLSTTVLSTLYNSKMIRAHVSLKNFSQTLKARRLSVRPSIWQTFSSMLISAALFSQTRVHKLQELPLVTRTHQWTSKLTVLCSALSLK